MNLLLSTLNRVINTKRCLPRMGLAGGVVALGLLASAPAKALDLNEIVPGSLVFGASGSQTASGTQDYSVGFFFDILSNEKPVTALGFSAQSNVAWTVPYTVKLWAYETDPTLTTTVYTPLAEKVFTPGDPVLIPTDDIGDSLIDNWWYPLDSFLTLPITGPAVDPNSRYGYVLAAFGSFNAPNGNFIEADGTVVFHSQINYDGNGYNVFGSPEYPVPAFLQENPPGTPVYGYWNPNIAFAPGPLPAMGAAAAFGWARQLRKRIKQRA